MTIPNVFANVSQLDTPDLDENFNFLGALVIIPCTESGTNTILLTTSASLAPAVTTYTNYSPIFSFIAAASCSGAVTVNINSIGAKNLYKGNGLVAVGSGDIIVGGMYWIAYNSALNSGNGGFVIGNPSTATSNPTVQRLTSGTAATYSVTSAGVVRQRLPMCGGGGGGGGAGAGAGAGGLGTATSFQVNASGTAWTAAAGTQATPGSGGTDGATTNATLILRMAGGAGSNGGLGVAGNSLAGGAAGINPFGGGSGTVQNGTALAPLANTGAGGGGAGSTGAAQTGTGGGAGEYVELWLFGCSTATYTIGTGGAAGAGATAGRAGATGVIVIEEFYS